MPTGKLQKVRVRILVKAYPQPSRTYGETVCVAAITEDGTEMLRLYPIRFRRLESDTKFDRFDLVEMEVERRKGDSRPESRHVNEESIKVLSKGSELTEESKVQFWKPFVADSLTQLHADNENSKRSLGIVRPDLGSMKFFIQPTSNGSEQERALEESTAHQNSLFENSLTPLEPSGFSFGYRFTSGGSSHRHVLHDWEVQTAYFQYKRRYGEAALEKLKQEYGVNIPKRNPHFIMGTMHQHPKNFIVIGILRTGIDPSDLDRQKSLI